MTKTQDILYSSASILTFLKLIQLIQLQLLSVIFLVTEDSPLLLHSVLLHFPHVCADVHR